MNVFTAEKHSNRSYQEMLMKKFVEIDKVFQKKNKGKKKFNIILLSFKHI